MPRQPQQSTARRSVVRGWLTAIARGLTTRGRSFIAAGLAAVICAFVLGQRDLLRVGVLLLALPLGCAAVVARAQFRLSLVRTVAPPRVVVGTLATVRLELSNLTRVSTRVLLAEDHIPYTLGPSPRFVVARLPGGRRAAVTYSLHPSVRGRYDIGPLALAVSDPFGMCEAHRAFTATDPLVVVPRTWPLVGAPGGGQWSGTGEATHGVAAASGEHDLATREYRHGDDLRRVHWRSTARRGELMVRREEQPRQMRATVLLDARPEAHRGEGPASSFEWAVGAAASVATHLSGQRFGVRLLIDEPNTTWTTAGGPSGVTSLLDRLAVADLGGAPSLADNLRALARSGGDGVVVAVLGDIAEDDARALASTRPSGSGAFAILLRIPAWVPHSLPPAIEAELEQRRERAATVLRSAGWPVAEAGPGDSITTVWRQAGSPGPQKLTSVPTGVLR